MTNFFRASFAAAAVAIAGTAFTFGIAAGPAMAQQRVAVPVRAAELGSVQGRSALNYRITVAARTVCAAHDGEPGLAARTAARRCVDKAVADAGQQLAALKASRVMLASN